MIFNANSVLKGSPGPMVGLPRYGPIVEPMVPPSPVDGKPTGARFVRLKRLYIFALNWTLTLSAIAVVLMAERSNDS